MFFSKRIAALVFFGAGIGTTTAGVQRVQRRSGVPPQENFSELAYTSCQLSMRSTPDLSGNAEDAITDFQDAVEPLFISNFPNRTFDTVQAFTFNTTHNEDGTNNILSIFAVEDTPEAQLNSLINTWVAQELTVNGPKANWTFEGATCQDSVVSCNLAVSSNPAESNRTASSDIPFAVTTTLQNHFPASGFLIAYNAVVPNADLAGNYNITSFIGVNDETEEVLFSFVTSLEGTTISGLQAEWDVEAVSCIGPQ